MNEEENDQTEERQEVDVQVTDITGLKYPDHLLSSFDVLVKKKTSEENNSSSGSSRSTILVIDEDQQEDENSQQDSSFPQHEVQPVPTVHLHRLTPSGKGEMSTTAGGGDDDPNPSSTSTNTDEGENDKVSKVFLALR